MKGKILYRLGTWVVILSLLAIFAVVLQTNRYAIVDWWILRSYEPSQSIMAIADEIKLTDKGTNLFYVHDPRVLEPSEFNQACSDEVKETNIILGCYYNRQINIFEVDDARLDGVIEVTAAHELLHAAYDRLSGEYKQEVDDMLLEAQANVASARLTKAISGYSDLPEDQLLNELHSLMGTIVSNLPAPLEAYYSQYFEDRQVIVAADEAYESVFEELKRQIEVFDARLAELKISIENIEYNLSILNNEIANDRNNLNLLLSQGNIEEYNQQRVTFNAKVRNFNDSVGRLNGFIDEFNNILEQKISIGIEQNQLYESIDSRQETESVDI